MSIRIGSDLLSLIGDKSSPAAEDNVYYDKTNKKLVTSTATVDLNQEKRLVPKTSTFSTEYALHPATSTTNPIWQKLNTEVSITMVGNNGFSINSVKAIKLDKNLYQVSGKVTGTLSAIEKTKYLNFASITQIEKVNLNVPSVMYPNNGIGEMFYVNGRDTASAICFCNSQGKCYATLNNVQPNPPPISSSFYFTMYLPFSATDQYNGTSL